MTPAYAEHLEAAAAIVDDAGVVDLHVDSIIQQMLFGYDVLKEHKPGRPGQPLFWHADVPRMIEAGYVCANMGIHSWPFENAGGPPRAHRQIDYLDRIAEAHPGCMRIRTPDDWDTAIDGGKLGLVPGVEGAHMLDGRIEELHRLLDRGIAYLTLAHFSRNSAATPSMGRGANEDDTLTPFGEDVVRTLNERGCVVDVSHLNQPCAIRAAELSAAPVFATHSGAQGVHRHPRLLSDDAIDRIAEKDGAIGIIFGPDFLAGDAKAGTEAVVDHIDYIAERVGIRHLAIGSDYDGWLPRILSDHRDCRDVVRIAAEMLRRGYEVDAIAGVLSGNARRVVAAAWAARSA